MPRNWSGRPLPREAAAATDRPLTGHPETHAQHQGRLALAALERGRQALDAGAARDAVAWLERAVRYAPEDPTPRLSLAAAWFAAGNAGRARTGFAAVAERADVREAWLGLAAAALRLGDGAEAARAMGHCLSRHRWTGADPLAEAVRASSGLFGWCSLAADERLILSAAGGGVPVQIRADGRATEAEGFVAAGVRTIEVTAAGKPFLGSPIDVAAIRRIEGVAAARDGGVEGWAWYPADPERLPRLTLSDGTRALVVTASNADMTLSRPLTRPRGWRAAATDLAELGDRIAVRDQYGNDVPGSPVDRGLVRRAAREAALRVAAAFPLCAGPTTGEPGFAPVPAGTRGAPASAPLEPERHVAVVIPAYRGARETEACIAACAATGTNLSAIVVVDDASPDADLTDMLARAASAGRIRLIRHARNLGFPGAANAGLRAAAAAFPQADLVLLNSDTVPAPGWLEALRAAVHAEPDIGTACPLSNDATILSYPDPDTPSPAPSARALRQLASAAARANAETRVEIPTAVGFCVYLRRECLVQTGLLREDLFGRGYGEENDLCLRARHLGWRHVAVPGVYVAHASGTSFGAERDALVARNMAVLESLHPGYGALIANWKAADPLRPTRQRLDAVLWAARARRSRGRAVILVTHDSGGGVERCIQTRRTAIEADGGVAVILRPVLDRRDGMAESGRQYLSGLCRATASDATKAPWPTLTHGLPDELPALVDLLRLVRPVGVELHHLLGHDHSVTALAQHLGVPYEAYVHDYAWFCPRVTLISAGGRYCGEPELDGCEACVADFGSRLEEPIGVRDLVARSRADLSGAARVVAPSADAARRIARHFPGIRPLIVPHEADDVARPLPLTAGADAGRTVCVVGAIGTEKGYDVLLACARDATARRLPLRFRIVGRTIDDQRLLDTGVAFVTGPYAEGEAQALIQEQRADVGFIPSVWPETWCFALGEAWCAGLNVIAFDLGAQSERIRATGRGLLLPLGLPASAVNNALLTFMPLAADERVMQTLASPVGGRGHGAGRADSG